MNDQTRRAIIAELHHLVDSLGGIPEEVAREQAEEWVSLVRSLGYEPDDRVLRDAALVIAQQIMGILLVQETVSPEDPVVGCLKAVLYVLATTAFTKEMG
jgi:hypothetical protein